MSVRAAAAPSPWFETPPLVRTADGAPRRVGVEVEFMGIGAGTAARALASDLGGTVVAEDPHAFRVQGSALGDLAVELDLRHAHPHRHAGALRWQPGRQGAALLGSALRLVVPHELITAPLPLDRLPEVDRAVAALARAGAAVPRRLRWGRPGLHVNVDVPRLDAGVLLAHLRAYMVLEPWLRRAAPSSQPGRYPAAYVARVLDPAYRPDLAGFARDYLDANPSRDRGLDLLPVLLHHDAALVRERLPHEKIGARPVFHYRLPLARVGEAGWSLAEDWNRWVRVERLAAAPATLADLGGAYRRFAGDEAAWAASLDGADAAA